MTLDDESHQPLKRVVLCCTSLAQDVRTTLVEAATAMGAVHKSDLTADVTHLIVGRVCTPKYSYVARERQDIHVLQPDFIEAARQAWIRGEDVDVSALEAEYRLPAFSGLHICLTGFNDPDARTYIAESVQRAGATYHGDLTKTITHLIAASPEGAKYSAARQWGLKIVSLKWFKDSLRRNMALDDSLYDINMPIEQQGLNAFQETVESDRKPVKRAREDDPGESAVGPGKRKLRRTLSTRLDVQSQDMWQDITCRRTNPEEDSDDQWKENEAEHSIAKRTTPPRAAATIISVKERSPCATNSLFSGCQIVLAEFDDHKTAKLRKFLEPNGAEILESISVLQEPERATASNRFVLVPHTPPNGVTSLPHVSDSVAIATEWWVERCLHSRRLINPRYDPLSRPLWNIHIAEFATVRISTTGFGGVDVRQLAETVRMMGGNYQETISPSTSVLISQSENIKKEKAYYAKKHNIPVVTVQWLWECLDEKHVVPQSDFQVKLPSLDPAQFDQNTNAGTAPSTHEPKQHMSDGQGKPNSLSTRLSTSRRRHATPSLTLETVPTAPASPAKSTSNRPTFVHEDNDETTSTFEHTAECLTKGVEQHSHDSAILRERSPNTSPRKIDNPSSLSKSDNSMARKTSTRLEQRTDANSEPNIDSAQNSFVAPPADGNSANQAFKKREDLTADLAALLNRTSSASSRTEEPSIPRKRRPLGRNLSGNSSHILAPQALAPDLSALLPSEMTRSSADGQGFHNGHASSLQPPGTQLGYDTPDADAHRILIGRKMGVSLADENEAAASGRHRVASVGVARDSDVNVGGHRLRSRHRGK